MNLYILQKSSVLEKSLYNVYNGDKEMIIMHYRGTIWRPPFESNSALLQITSGCTHHSCKFCSLYDVDFRMSPIKEIEEDLRELSKLMPNAKRVFMTGANPMVLPFEKLKDLFELIHQYLPNVKSIGGFARITDLVPKSTSELRELHYLGLDGISIGTETGDDDVLSYMNKGNTASQTIKQCKKLDTVGIGYHITYLTGLAGHNKGEENAIESAKVFNMLSPQSINIVALTIFPESELYKEIQTGKYIPSGEVEKILELKTLIERLSISTVIHANTISNLAPFIGRLPQDKARIIQLLEQVAANADENTLLDFRKNICHL